jgi:hypothetical protein
LGAAAEIQQRSGRRLEDGHPIDKIECGKTKPKIERWSKLVPADKQDRLRASFASRDLLAEQALAKIAGVLGIDERHACTGYGYLTESGEVADAVAHLRFQLAVRPAYERPAEGPPRLTGPAVMVPMSIAVGGVFRAVATALNEGGAGRNFYVVTHGPAIEAGLVEPEKVRVVIGLPHKGGTVLEAPARKKALPDGRPCFLADFPDGAIPASNAGGREALRGLGTTEAVELHMKAQIHSTVEGRAVAAGSADLVVSLVCREAREHPAHQGYELTVAPTPRKPLRGSSDDPSHYLALASPEAIVALAASTLSQADAAPIALEIVEKWSHLWRRDITLEATFFGEDGPARPTKPGRATLKVATLTKGAAWKRVRAAFSDANCVGADHRLAIKPGEPPRGGDGFAFGGPLVRPFVEVAGRESRNLPTLRLVVSLEGRTDGPQLLEQARTLVDEFARRAQCAQAVLMRCRPGLAAYMLDHSAYEDACGIRGQHTLHREWCTRFLRGVSADGIWLGRELLARVDRAALDVLCHLEPVGETVRAVLRDGMTLDALEATLAPLLPTTADWKEAAHARGTEAREALRQAGIDLDSPKRSRD